MLIIVFKETSIVDGKPVTSYPEVGWHIGQKPPKISETDAIQLVSADGDELDYIKRSFTNIMMQDKKVIVEWTGETAKFIALNL